ncbi:MAG: agmatine deiminase [Sulfurovum sp. AS07-7]|nr:MAG: agmatine deiminase [Sulfurovum sp. AS07-7]
MLAEWEEQRAVLVTFPHEDSDWADNLNSALTPFVQITQAIAYAQNVFVVCKDVQKIKNLFCSTNNMSFIQLPTNDTWTRDYGVISIEKDGVIGLLDFTFDAWGGKFEASLDNEVNKKLFQKGYFAPTTMQSIDFVLEGGSLESDGEGTILTTTECLCNPNRNGGLTQIQVEQKLQEYLGASRILWLNHGYLAGDDTNSHIDTLARFVSKDTIAFVECNDENDEHYEELLAMKKELQQFTQTNNDPYNLVALPMPSAKFDEENNRLPATYANFLITNKALLYPTYSVKEDKIAHEIFKNLFPSREIIPIECSRLIEQGGSLHCSTMQIAKR